jgi:L-iditol 2-dehydrogenase
MRQARLAAPRSIEWHDAPTPQPGPGEVLVRVRAALTCGTDLKTYRRGHPKLRFGPFGHEASGDVIALGPNVKEFKIGDAVMWVHTAPCGECQTCVAGYENLCEHLLERAALGTYADMVMLPPHIVRRNVFKKPVGVSYIEAAFLEPLACIAHGWRVLRRANAERPMPHNVAIIGAGAIGMLHLLYAVHARVRTTVVARRGDRLTLAQRLGAHDTVDAREPARMAGMSGKFAAVIECAGSADAWREAVNLARPGGRVLFFGGLPAGSEVSFDATRFHYDELTMLGAFHFSPEDVKEARDLLVSGALNLRPLVSAIAPLANLTDIFERLDRREGYKYALIPEPAPAEWV